MRYCVGMNAGQYKKGSDQLKIHPPKKVSQKDGARALSQNVSSFTTLRGISLRLCVKFLLVKQTH